MRGELYFAYGSNLCRDDLQRWCDRRSVAYPLGEVVGKAYLPDHEYVFNYYSSSRNAGALNLRPHRGQVVPGVLFRVQEDGWPILDLKEGAPYRYCRREVTVLQSDGSKQRATAYFVTSEFEEKHLIAPAQDYLDAVIRGLRQYRLAGSEQLLAAAQGKTIPFVIDSLFIYGTLLRGERNERVIGSWQQCQSVTMAQTAGKLIGKNNSFPGLLPDASRTVAGELVRHRDIDTLLASTDRLEHFVGYLPENNSMYHRVLQWVQVDEMVPDELAWTYHFCSVPAEIAQNLSITADEEIIASGNWREHSGVFSGFIKALISEHCRGQYSMVLAELANIVPEVAHCGEEKALGHLATAMRERRLSEHRLAAISGRAVVVPQRSHTEHIQYESEKGRWTDTKNP